MSTISRTVRVGTRASKLAVRQTEIVVDLMRAAAPQLDFEITRITTTGDKLADLPIGVTDEKGIFVKEIEAALLRGEIDIAVHSLKDVPSQLSGGLTIEAIPPRSDPRDALISAKGLTLRQLPRGATIGTSSSRRSVQLKALRNDIRVIPIRGNIETRLRKMRDRGLDGIVVAAAAMERLGLQASISEYLDPSAFLPAVGQGAIAVEVREDATAVRELVRLLNDRNTSVEVSAERSFMRTVGGGCKVPMGALAVLRGNVLALDGFVVAPHGLFRAQRSGELNDEAPLRSAEDIGAQLGELLLERVEHPTQ